MVDPIQTSDAEGKLPLDIGNVDEKGVSHLTRKAPAQEAPPNAEEAPKGDAQTKKGGTPSAPETVSMEEVEKRIASVKGGYEGTLKKMREDYAKAQQTLVDLQAKQEEQELANFLKGVEATGGDVDMARRVAEMQKTLRVKEQSMLTKEAELREREQLLNEAGRTKSAYDLLKTYELPEKALEELLKAEDPTAMENKALKMHIDALKGKTVSPESPDQAPVKKSGLDLSKMRIEERIGRAASGEF